MTPVEFKRVEEIFNAVIAMPAADRAAFLERECAADSQLRREVETLLAFDSGDAGLRTLDVREGIALRRAALSDSEPIPAKIAAYRPLREIGRGGFGIVYLAEQDLPRRTVALKVLRPGLSSPGILRRFEYEADVLGRLHHPGIAQIFEAGVHHNPDGGRVAFVAMEFIDGLPLNAYAEQKKLGVRARMELLARVCDAVQHAHQHGVIHRDLKPANILVADDEESSGTPPTLSRDATVEPASGRAYGNPQPKILDFGVARAADPALSSSTLLTDAGQMIGTLPYMSPEQVGGDPQAIDTRSDVYALGVLLYELLAGRRPYDLEGRSTPEVIRAICEAEPRRISAVSRELRGEVETIVGKALEKDPARRYQSAAELASDIRCYLAGEPIAAKRDSALYLLRKSLRRYRSTILVAAAFVVFALLAAIQATRQAEKNRLLALSESAERGRAQAAQAEAERARALSDESRVELAEELRISHVEQGRLAGKLGNMRVAEEMLWHEHLTTPGSPYTLWALRELYSTRPSLLTLAGGGATWPAFVDDDRSLFLLRPDATEIVQAASGARLTTVEIPFVGAPLLCVRHPIEPRMAVFERGGWVRLIDLQTLRTLVDGRCAVGEIRALLFDPPTGALIAVGAAGSIAAYDGESLRELWRAKAPGSPRVAAIAPGRRLLAMGTAGGEIALFDMELRKEVFRQACHEQSIESLAFSPNEDLLASGDSNRTIQLWDVESRRTLRTIRCENENVTSLAFHPDGKLLASAGWWQVDLWRVDTLSRVESLTGHSGGVTHIEFSDDGSLLTVADEKGAVRVWETAADGGFKALPGAYSSQPTADFSPDGKRLLVSGRDGTLVLADPRDGARLAEITGSSHGEVEGVCVLPDGRSALTGDANGFLSLWDLEQRTCVRTTAIHARELFAVLVSADGQYVFTGGRDRFIHRRELPSLEPAGTVGRSSTAVGGLVSNPSRTEAIAAPGGPNLMLWPLEPDASPKTIEAKSSTWCAAWSPDGSFYCTGDWNGVVCIWDPATSMIRSRCSAFENLVSMIAASHDGNLIAAGTTNGEIKLIDPRSGQILATLGGHTALITCLEFSPDDRLLVSGSRDGRVGVRDLQYNDSHIAGNLESAIARFGSAAEPGRIEQVRAWSEEMRQRTPLGGGDR
ncbi:MAG: protein kinase [Planctomycetes bacterium]|nr:protein kinase [Planctomycetota bacterium]